MKTNHRLVTRTARWLSLAAAATTATTTTTSRANVIDARFTGIGDFSFGVEYMTDLDQRRSGLPGDGKAYCVPTSAMNLFGYAANFGFSDLLPGPGVWEGVPGHGLISGYLEVLGLLMNTHADDGTTLSGQSAGFTGWLELNDLASMSVVTFARDGDYWPTVDVGAYMSVAGARVNFAFGRYQWTPGPGGEPWLTNRNVGHSVTLQRAFADNGQYEGPRQIGIHNPSGASSDNDLFSNSNYSADQFLDAENIVVTLDVDQDGDLDECIATSLFPPDPGAEDNRYRLIDSVTALYPPGGLGYTSVELNAEFAGGNLGFASDRPPTQHGAPAGSSVISVIPHPELHSALALLRDPSGEALYQMPHGTRRTTRLLDLPRGSKFLVLGHGQSVYAISPSGITGLRVRSHDASRLGAVALPSSVRGTPIEAAAYNDATDELLLLSGTAGRLHVFDAATLRLVKSFVLRSATGPIAIRTASVLPVPPKAAAGRNTPTVAPWGPRRVIMALAKGGVAQLDYPGTATAGGPSSIVIRPLPLPGVRDALSADLDSGRRLYVSDRTAGLLEYTVNATGAWSRAVKPFLQGSKFVGRKFSAFRSRTNLQPGVHDQPEWSHVIDDEKE